MGLLETEEQDSFRKRRNKGIMVIFIGVICIMVVGVVAYDHIKPLPQLTECTKIGYQAGERIKDRIVCYKNCDDNNVKNCLLRRVLI